ncbi:BCCT family transporter [Bogoriella caseilytica]|nr:BCCT family transporter [Bogoriella caseilytica]
MTLVPFVTSVIVPQIWSGDVAESVETGLANTIETTMQGVVSGLGPWMVVAVAGFVLFSLVMGLSRFGDIKLGQDDDKPEFSLLSWFAMLFAAGMGIGLVFWGAAEPLEYFTSPRPGVNGERLDGAAEGYNHWVEGDIAGVAEQAMNQTFLHWGFHAWAIYAVIGLALAYAIHRKGRPVSIRWTLEPLLGDRVKGWIGDVIDVIAIVGTVFGVATSLGLGVSQIAAGLNHLGLIPSWGFDEDGSVGSIALILVIVVVSGIALISVVSGVGKGIKWLSNVNLGMAAIFLIAMLLLGPTLWLLRTLVESIGDYLGAVVPLTFHTAAYTGEEGFSFQRWWTVFYWGWWISWAPFVGVFIARISKGRTVRQFIGGVLLVPTVMSFVWFTVMGAGAIYEAWEDGGEGRLWSTETAGTVGEQPEAVLFNYIDVLAGGGTALAAGLAIVATVMVAIFFITSSDSGSLVIDMIASGGELDPPKWSRAMWAGLEGLVAILLLVAGGLTLLRDAAILTSVPVMIVMLAMCVALWKALNGEHQVLVEAERRHRREELERRVAARMETHVEKQVDETLDEQFPDRFREELATVTVRMAAEHEPGASPSTPGEAGAAFTLPEAPKRRSWRRRRD